MKSLIRKNEFAPDSAAAGVIANHLFRHLEARPKSKQAERVEQILEKLSRLGRGDVAAFFQNGDLLSRYEWHYRLTYSGSRGLRAELMFTKELPEEDAWEYRAVRFLMSLVPHHINRLRRCADAKCNKWFFAARREDQQYCSGNCRQHHYDSDPVRRAAKREYMRDDYRPKQRKIEEMRKHGVKFRDSVNRRAKKSLR